MQAPTVPRLSSLLPTLCLGLPPHKSGKMTPECQQWPSVGLTRARGKGQRADPWGKDVSKDSSGSINHHPPMGLMTDTTVGGTAHPHLYHHSPLPSHPLWDSLTTQHFSQILVNNSPWWGQSKGWLYGICCPLVSAHFQLIIAPASRCTGPSKPQNCC